MFSASIFAAFPSSAASAIANADFLGLRVRWILVPVVVARSLETILVSAQTSAPFWEPNRNNSPIAIVIRSHLLGPLPQPFLKYGNQLRGLVVRTVAEDTVKEKDDDDPSQFTPRKRRMASANATGEA